MVPNRYPRGQETQRYLEVQRVVLVDYVWTKNVPNRDNYQSSQSKTHEQGGDRRTAACERSLYTDIQAVVEHGKV